MPNCSASFLLLFHEFLFSSVICSFPSVSIPSFSAFFFCMHCMYLTIVQLFFTALRVICLSFLCFRRRGPPLIYLNSLLNSEYRHHFLFSKLIPPSYTFFPIIPLVFFNTIHTSHRCLR